MDIGERSCRHASNVKSGGVHMPALRQSCLVLICAALLAGCANHAAYKSIKVAVIDFETRTPVSGVTVSTTYFNRGLFSAADTKRSSGVTGPEGTVILQGNFLKTEPSRLGDSWPESFQPAFEVRVENVTYVWNSTLRPAHHPSDIHERAAGVVFSRPDYIFEIEPSGRLRKELADKLAGPVSYWPEEKEVDFYAPAPNADASVVWPKPDLNALRPTIAARYVMARWESAAMGFHGTEADKDAIRRAVATRIHPGSLIQYIAERLDHIPEVQADVLRMREPYYANVKIEEYRCFGSDWVMVKLADATASREYISTESVLFPPGYVPPLKFFLCVLQRQEGTWAILRKYPVVVAQPVPPAMPAGIQAYPR